MEFSKAITHQILHGEDVTQRMFALPVKQRRADPKVVRTTLLSLAQEEVLEFDQHRWKITIEETPARSSEENCNLKPAEKTSEAVTSKSSSKTSVETMLGTDDSVSSVSDDSDSCLSVSSTNWIDIEDICKEDTLGDNEILRVVQDEDLATTKPKQKQYRRPRRRSAMDGN